MKGEQMSLIQSAKFHGYSRRGRLAAGATMKQRPSGLKGDAMTKQKVVPPTHEQLWEDDGVERVTRDVDDGWRHGAYITQVFHRKSDDTYWSVWYRLSTCGETNELADGTCEIKRVQRVEKTAQVVTYE